MRRWNETQDWMNAINGQKSHCVRRSYPSQTQFKTFCNRVMHLKDAFSKLKPKCKKCLEGIQHWKRLQSDDVRE